jgi:hypothetical protein
MTEVTLFNKVIEQLLDNLKIANENATLSDKKEISVMTEKIEYLRKFNSKKLFELFITYVYSNQEYRQNILSKNDAFFINENNESKFSDDVNSKIFTLKGIWTKLSGENKNTVWVYFQTLIKIVDKYIQKSVNGSADSVS